MFTLGERQRRMFDRVRRKYNVSLEFIRYSMPNILKFLAYQEKRLHFVLKCCAIRNPRNRSIVIKYNYLCRSLYDEMQRKRRKCRNRNMKQWSRRMVLYLRRVYGVKEFVVVEKTRECKYNQEEVSKQLKEQLEILKSGKRSTQLIDCSEEPKSKNILSHKNNSESIFHTKSFETVTRENEQDITERPSSFVPLKTTNQICSNSTSNSSLNIQNESHTSVTSKQPGILDLLMSKVGAPVMPLKEVAVPIAVNPNDQDPSADSGEEFLGFSEEDHVPGMMRTPLVPLLSRSKDENSAFVSETLDEYFRKNSLDRNIDLAKLTSLSLNRKFHQANIDGLVTLNCVPPSLEMPAVPAALQKMRTVAERRHYLQKFSKNYKLAIINNEATIYRELQRKIRQPKIKIGSQQALQTPYSKMSFTRQGWHAASFVTTDLNKYYFQKMNVDNSQDIELRGVLGNNVNQYKNPYISKIEGNQYNGCSRNCVDCGISSCLKVIPTFPNKKKLCNEPLRAIFKPCPLSHKPFQPLLCDEACESLVTGGKLSVVRLPTVELNVYPEVGKPFNDIAKRYLEYVMPYESITKEWAEFSLSTLTHHCGLGNQRKCFAFPVPYLNDRSHVLVRRVVDRSEKLDPCFEKQKSGSDVDYNSDLSFRQNLDESDELVMECANILTEMITSVAISCSENSFTNEDPDKIYVESDISTTSPKLKSKNLMKGHTNAKVLPTVKKSRLISELRRLNATIIDTKLQVKNGIEPCSKEFCKLGCVCESIGSSYPLPQHCSRLQCMFECDCEKKTKSQILRLKSNNHTISSEDAYMMRREATSRLARMEKEFTSTVVVTENETLLINDSQYDKKRRCTKIPKRYEDFRGPDEDPPRLSPIKSFGSSLVSPACDTKKIPLISTEIAEPVLVKDCLLQKLKHCSVALTRFQDIHNMAVFCLIHQLYKCFCGGRAVEGKRVIIEKEIINTKIRHDKDITLRTPSLSKSTYTFERLEIENDFNEFPIEKEPQLTPDKEIELANAIIATPQKPLKFEFDFATDYFRKSESHGCIRLVPVPTCVYTDLNKKRHGENLHYIKCTENKRSRLLLNERIMRSMYFHKEKQKKHKIESKVVLDHSQPQSKKLKLSEHVDREQCDKQKGHEDLVIVGLKSECTKTPVVKRPSISSTTDSQPAVKRARKSEELNVDLTKEEGTDLSLAKDIQLPKISACYSLNSYTKTFEACQPKETTTNSSSFPMPINDDGSSEMRDHYNEVIKMLNGLVSRKMHDIDNALKRDSKIVPPPTEDILCVLQWKNFLDAFREGLIFIWEVKMKTRTFLAATVANMVPMVFGALAVMNIGSVPKQRLPLLGSMLLHDHTIKNSMNLAVIMQGRSQYWYIKGFLQPNSNNVCLKPTPETHPTLTQKINTLCSSFIKQRTKETDKRETTVKRVEESITAEQVNAKNSDSHPSADYAASTSNETSPIKLDISALKKISKFSITKKENNTALPSSSDVLVNKPIIAKSKCDDLKKTNVELREINFADVKYLQRPEYYEHDHNWFVLDIQNDFSHIFVPEQKEIISLERIQRLMALSQEKEKVIQIQFLNRSCFDAYIVPGCVRKVYFGPFKINAAPPAIVLLQSVDGKMMTRETFQRLRKVQKISECTTAFWMTLQNGEISLRTGNMGMMKTFNECEKSLSKNKVDNINNVEEKEDEEDCMIVDNSDKQHYQPSINPIGRELKHAIKADTRIQTHSQAINVTSKEKRTQHTKESRVDFTIRTSHKTNQLKIIPSLATKNSSSQKTITVENINKPSQNHKVFISELLPNTNISNSPKNVNTNLGNADNKVSFGQIEHEQISVKSQTKNVAQQSLFQAKSTQNVNSPIRGSVTKKKQNAYAAMQSNKIHNRMYADSGAKVPTKPPIVTPIIEISSQQKERITEHRNLLKSGLNSTSTSNSTATASASSKLQCMDPTITNLKKNLVLSQKIGPLMKVNDQPPQHTFKNKIVNTFASAATLPNNKLSQSTPPCSLLKFVKNNTMLQSSATKISTQTPQPSNVTSVVAPRHQETIAMKRTTADTGVHNVRPQIIKVRPIHPSESRRSILNIQSGKAAVSSKNPIPPFLPNNDTNGQQRLPVVPIPREPQMRDTTRIGSTGQNVSIVYGRFISEAPELPQFFAHRTKQNEYFINMSGIGIARVKELERINRLLNQYIAKHTKFSINNALRWKFEPNTKSNERVFETESKTVSTARTKAEIDRSESDMFRQTQCNVRANTELPRKQYQNTETIIIED